MATNVILGLDIGEKRIGVARVNTIARLPQPLGTYQNDLEFLGNLNRLINEYLPDQLVVGLPRNMNGQETAQSQYVRDFCAQQLMGINIPIVLQDETLSSVEAEARLKDKKHLKSEIDAQAAVVILEDYLNSIG